AHSGYVSIYAVPQACPLWGRPDDRIIDLKVRNYFGPDGIRGKAKEGAMTAETALRVGMAAGRVFRRGDHRHRVGSGKVTRLSGYMLEPALTAGFTSMGIDVFLFGPLPTTYRKNKRPFHPIPTAFDRS
ncbi:hypothetical protein OHV40_19525, partial [Acinetobacter baumannii]|nr:hypothetical protein [Acinetobacter baumannii]